MARTSGAQFFGTGIDLNEAIYRAHESLRESVRKEREEEEKCRRKREEERRNAELKRQQEERRRQEERRAAQQRNFEKAFGRMIGGPSEPRARTKPSTMRTTEKSVSEKQRQENYAQNFARMLPSQARSKSSKVTPPPPVPSTLQEKSRKSLSETQLRDLERRGYGRGYGFSPSKAKSIKESMDKGASRTWLRVGERMIPDYLERKYPQLKIDPTEAPSKYPGVEDFTGSAIAETLKWLTAAKFAGWIGKGLEAADVAGKLGEAISKVPAGAKALESLAQTWSSLSPAAQTALQAGGKTLGSAALRATARLPMSDDPSFRQWARDVGVVAGAQLGGPLGSAAARTFMPYSHPLVHSAMKVGGTAIGAGLGAAPFAKGETRKERMVDIASTAASFAIFSVAEEMLGGLSARVGSGSIPRQTAYQRQVEFLKEQAEIPEATKEALAYYGIQTPYDQLSPEERQRLLNNIEVDFRAKIKQYHPDVNKEISQKEAAELINEFKMIKSLAESYLNQTTTGKTTKGLLKEKLNTLLENYSMELLGGIKVKPEERKSYDFKDDPRTRAIVPYKGEATTFGTPPPDILKKEEPIVQTVKPKVDQQLSERETEPAVIHVPSSLTSKYQEGDSVVIKGRKTNKFGVVQDIREETIYTVQRPNGEKTEAFEGQLRRPGDKKAKGKLPELQLGDKAMLWLTKTPVTVTGIRVDNVYNVKDSSGAVAPFTESQLKVQQEAPPSTQQPATVSSEELRPEKPQKADVGLTQAEHVVPTSELRPGDRVTLKPLNPKWPTYELYVEKIRKAKDGQKVLSGFSDAYGKGKYFGVPLGGENGFVITEAPDTQERLMGTATPTAPPVLESEDESEVPPQVQPEEASAPVLPEKQAEVQPSSSEREAQLQHVVSVERLRPGDRVTLKPSDSKFKQFEAYVDEVQNLHTDSPLLKVYTLDEKGNLSRQFRVSLSGPDRHIIVDAPDTVKRAKDYGVGDTVRIIKAISGSRQERHVGKEGQVVRITEHGTIEVDLGKGHKDIFAPKEVELVKARDIQAEKRKAEEETKTAQELAQKKEKIAEAVEKAIAPYARKTEPKSTYEIEMLFPDIQENLRKIGLNELAAKVKALAIEAKRYGIKEWETLNTMNEEDYANMLLALEEENVTPHDTPEWFDKNAHRFKKGEKELEKARAEEIARKESTEEGRLEKHLSEYRHIEPGGKYIKEEDWVVTDTKSLRKDIREALPKGKSVTVKLYDGKEVKGTSHVPGLAVVNDGGWKVIHLATGKAVDIAHNNREQATLFELHLKGMSDWENMSEEELIEAAESFPTPINKIYEKAARLIPPPGLVVYRNYNYAVAEYLDTLSKAPAIEYNEQIVKLIFPKSLKNLPSALGRDKFVYVENVPEYGEIVGSSSFVVIGPSASEKRSATGKDFEGGKTADWSSVIKDIDDGLKNGQRMTGIVAMKVRSKPGEPSVILEFEEPGGERSYKEILLKVYLYMEGKGLEIKTSANEYTPLGGFDSSGNLKVIAMPIFTDVNATGFKEVFSVPLPPIKHAYASSIEPATEKAPPQDDITADACKISGMPAGSAAPAVPTPQVKQPRGNDSAVGARMALVKMIEKKLEMPIREGYLYLKGAAGEYHHRDEVARVTAKNVENLRVISHELGHHLTKIMKLDPQAFPDLEALGAIIYPNALPDKQRREGLAEFVVHYLESPATAERRAPVFYKAFTQALDDFPEIKEKFEEVQDLLQKYRSFTGKDYVLSHVVRKPEKVKGKLIENTWEKFLVHWVDDLYPLLKAQQLLYGSKAKVEDIPMKTNPYMWARLARRASRSAYAFLKHAQVSPDLNVVGPSLEKIFKPLYGPKNAEKRDDFTAWIVAKRALELEEQGIETGFDDIGSLKQVAKDLESDEFIKLHNDLKAYRENLLDWLVDAGIFSHSLVEKWKDIHTEYVPFMRVFGSESVTIDRKPLGGKKAANIETPIKRIKGSRRSIVDPLSVYVQDTYYLMDIAKRGDVGQALAALYDQSKEGGLGWIITEVATPIEANAVKLDELRQDLIDAGVPEDALEDLDLKKTAIVFNPVRFARSKETKFGILAVRDKGRVRFFQVDPDLYETLMALDYKEASAVVKFLSIAARALRGGAVSTVNFLLRNIVRDTGTRAVVGKAPVSKLITGYIRALNEIIKKSDNYVIAEVAGAFFSSPFSRSGKEFADEFERFMGNLSPKDKVLNVFAAPWRVFESLLEMTEEGSRHAEHIHISEEGGKTKEAKYKGAFGGSEGTVDFQKAGKTAREFNRAIPFFTANIGGVSKFIGEIKDDPGKTIARGTLVALISLAMIAKRKMSKNAKNLERRYEEEEDWRKNNFWIYFRDDGSRVYIPKPHLPGYVFGTSLEVFIDYWKKKDPKVVEEFLKQFARDVTPDVIPALFLPIMEWYGNRRMFTGQEVVPTREKNLPPHAQYDYRTSEVAKALGKSLGLSPRKIDALIHGYTGSLGADALKYIDLALGKSKLPPEELIPGSKAFKGYRSIGRKSVDEYFNTLGKLEQKRNWHNKSPKEAPDLTNKEKYKLHRLSLFKKLITNLYAEIREIREDDKMSPRAKKKLVDKLELEITNLARRALEKEEIAK